jgi:hypothetical protein
VWGPDAVERVRSGRVRQVATAFLFDFWTR